MPAPVKSFIDPVGLYKGLLTGPPITSPTGLKLDQDNSFYAVTLPLRAGSNLETCGGFGFRYQGGVPFTAPTLPKPPVGKLLIATFPPIYKERTNYKGIADSPRQFPPIYITHLTS